MEENGTKVLSKVHPNSISPAERVESEDLKLAEEGRENEEGYGSEGG
jgi:hypothetical protein